MQNDIVLFKLSTMSYSTFLKKKKKKDFDKNFNSDLLSYYDSIYLNAQSKNTLFTVLLHLI